MADVALLDGVEYVGCSRTSRLQAGTARQYYRVSLRPAWSGFLTGWTLAQLLTELQGQLQAKSGDAVALADFVPPDVADYGWFDGTPATVDVMTLGAATKRLVADLVTAIEAAAQVTVVRVQLIDAATAHAPDRVTDRAVASDKAKEKEKTNTPLGSLGDTIDKLVLVVIVLAILAGLSYVMPRR
jgi:hypothetical protein